MKQQRKDWILKLMIDGVSDEYLDQDLPIVAACTSKDELFSYLKQEVQNEDYRVRDVLVQVIEWLKRESVTDENVQFYIAKRTCAELYFNRCPDLPIETRKKICDDLESLFESIKNPPAFLQEERERFLSAISTGGKKMGRFSANLNYKHLACGVLFVTPFLIIYAKKILEGEEMTDEDWAMARRYCSISLNVGLVVTTASYALYRFGVFDRAAAPTDDAESAYVAPPLESSEPDNNKKKLA